MAVDYGPRDLRQSGDRNGARGRSRPCHHMRVYYGNAASVYRRHHVVLETWGALISDEPDQIDDAVFSGMPSRTTSFGRTTSMTPDASTGQTPQLLGYLVYPASTTDATISRHDGCCQLLPCTGHPSVPSSAPASQTRLGCASPAPTGQTEAVFTGTRCIDEKTTSASPESTQLGQNRTWAPPRFGAVAHMLVNLLSRQISLACAWGRMPSATFVDDLACCSG